MRIARKLLDIILSLEYNNKYKGAIMLSFISAKEASEKWNISQRRVSVLCSENRIAGAMMVGNMWIIPANAQKPIDKRINKKEENKIYKVTIEETVSQDFEIEAKNIKEALKIAEEKYSAGEIVLSPGNLLCKQISATDKEGDIVNCYEF